MPHVRDSGDGEKAPFVSFLTTAYKTEQYVSETIESVLAQTRGDWEMIVVDNGNSDEMAQIIGNYTSDPRITLIRQDNKGNVGGVSAAAAAAEGRYFCLLDSDDAVQPDYCERIGVLIDADPGIDAVGCNAVLFRGPDADNRQKPRDYSSSRDPANIEAIEERLERTFVLVGREHGLSESDVAATAMVRRLRYHRSLRKARSALLAGDVQAARTAARDAFRQRRTLRAAVAIGGLHLSPGLLAAIHPAKNRARERAAACTEPDAWSTPRGGPHAAGVGGPRAPLEGEP